MDAHEKLALMRNIALEDLVAQERASFQRAVNAKRPVLGERLEDGDADNDLGQGLIVVERDW